jgi:uncharacterized membrane protein YhiD involved in acid resistance
MSATDTLLDANPWLDRLFGDITAVSGEDFGIEAVLARMISAAIVGWLIGQVYRRTFTGVRFNPTLPDTHVLLALGGALIWLVVGNSIVRAFGLAGTVGLIRYRTMVPDPKDTTILLFSLVMGMACGIGLLVVAWVGTLVLLMVMILLHKGHRRQHAAEAENVRILELFQASPAPDKPPERMDDAATR